MLDAPEPKERVLLVPPFVNAVENCVPFCLIDAVPETFDDVHDTDEVHVEAPEAIVQFGTVRVMVGVQVGS